MLGFVVGTACLIGLIKVLRHHGGGRYGYRRGGCGRGGWGGCGGGSWGGCGGPYGGGRAWRRHHHHGPWGHGSEGFDDDGAGGDEGGPGPVFLRGLFERLQTTPGQERVIAEALRELRAAFKRSAEEKAKGAKQVAEALRGDDFKVENMAEAFSHLETSTDAVRDASFSALARIHDALDARQRRILADLVGRGGRALEHLADQA